MALGDFPAFGARRTLFRGEEFGGIFFLDRPVMLIPLGMTMGIRAFPAKRSMGKGIDCATFRAWGPWPHIFS